MATFEIKGLKGVTAALAAVPNKARNKVVREAVRASLKPMLADTKAKAPVKTGALRRGIKLMTPRKRVKDVIRLLIRASAANASKKGKRGGDYTGDLFYGAFQEYGTKRLHAREFMKRAFYSGRTTARNVCIALIRHGLDDVIKSLKK